MKSEKRPDYKMIDVIILKKNYKIQLRKYSIKKIKK